MNPESFLKASLSAKALPPPANSLIIHSRLAYSRLDLKTKKVEKTQKKKSLKLKRVDKKTYCEYN